MNCIGNKSVSVSILKYILPLRDKTLNNSIGVLLLMFS